jgi:hypothetical protein
MKKIMQTSLIPPLFCIFTFGIVSNMAFAQNYECENASAKHTTHTRRSVSRWERFWCNF